jgi:hypothetical protein
MKQIKTASRVGIAVAGAAAMLTLGMAGPVQAAPTGGANQPCGAYCPTNTGAPSGNGNATTQPAAGTKGKADSKNPPGQYPNGTDSNAGYECDRNQGVGKSNPAHTGCRYYTPPPYGS